MIERALIIDKPWIDMILNGKKVWEMRSRLTKIRGTIGIIGKGSGLISGVCELVDSLPAQDDFSMHLEFMKHRITHELYKKDGFKWRFPWVFEHVQKLNTPIPYTHPQGAVTWVKVNLPD